MFFLNAVDKQKVTAVVLLDMNKAFDSLNHGIILDKLQDVGASTSALKWFEKYLSNRKQAVSDLLPVVSGVPQGSILGPLLFTIYVNDLSTVPKNSSSECYVDDTKLLMSFRVHECNNTVIAMTQDLLGIRNWCFDNRLLLNPGKTKLIVYSLGPV